MADLVEIELDVTPQNVDVEVSAMPSQVDVEVEVGQGGTSDHNKLINRDLPDQHPISAITGLQEALDNESQTRENADTGLGLRIDSEATARENADIVLGQRIDEEATERYNTDEELAQDIRNETTRAETAEINLNTAIEAEEQARIQADTTLQGNIDEVGRDLMVHISDMENPHEVTKAQVGLGNVKNVDTTDASNITSGTLSNDRLDTIPYSKLSGVASSAQGALADSALQPDDVINDVLHTDTDKPLSANMGKELNDRINNVEGRGRYLSQWNATIGQPETQPTELPYEYKAGDYYNVGTVGSVNYKPTGTSYTGVASTTVETAELAIDDVYFYDGSVWHLQQNTQKTVSFANLAGQPTDNSNLAAALNAKQDTISDLATIRSGAALGATALQSVPAEYVTQTELEAYHDSSKQNVTDNSLTTTAKTIVGAINELEARPSAPAIDNKTITKNVSQQLQASAVIDQNNTSNGIKTWTGTKAQYNALASKDSNTLYNITDEYGGGVVVLVNEPGNSVSEVMSQKAVTEYPALQKDIRHLTCSKAKLFIT